ncbi:MAG: hypothetical protein ABIO79_10095 [Ferruginibacter sp.]
MQKLFILICGSIFLSNTIIAQELTGAGIKKLKIKKIIVETVEEDDHETKKSKTEYFYDANGNDTALYFEGIRNWYKRIEYDARQRPASITRFSNDGTQTNKTVFTYSPDGSFIAVENDIQYGFSTTDVFDKKGSQLTHSIPDGSIHKYMYNSKGQLTKIFAVTKKDAVKFSREYRYNSAGKVIATKNKGEYFFNTTYEYDKKGLLKKATIRYADDPKGEVIKKNYEYGY